MIVKCEGCNGDGYISEEHDPWAIELLGCPDCEGRGWVDLGEIDGLRDRQGLQGDR